MSGIRRLDCFLKEATPSWEQAEIRPAPRVSLVSRCSLWMSARTTPCRRASKPFTVDVATSTCSSTMRGYELAGALEELSPQEAGAQFETNFFGVVRMVNAVLPSMRQQKRGHIINVGSLSGLSAIPFLGIYSASKFALEGYTEALRHEVRPFGIRVALTEAGFLKTPMMNNRQIAANPIAEYDPWRQRALDAIRAHEEKAPGPELVATTLLDIISSTTPRLRYPIGRQATSVARLRRFLPAGLFEQGVRRTFSLDKAR